MVFNQFNDEIVAPPGGPTYIKITISAAGYSENNDALYQDYEVQEVSETELMKTPTFRSLAQRFSANVGDTVRLPCLVDRLEGFVILWKKGADIITVASQILDKVCTPLYFEYGNISTEILSSVET